MVKLLYFINQNNSKDLNNLILIKDAEIKKLSEQNNSLKQTNDNLKKKFEDKISIDIKQKEKEIELLKKKNKEFELTISNLNLKINNFEQEKINGVYNKNDNISNDEINQINNKLILDLKKKENENKEEIDKKESVINELNLKITELNEEIKRLNDKILIEIKKKKDLEEIILKQEDNIVELNKIINQNYLIIQTNISEMNKNEVYINQLLTTIKEQKINMSNEKDFHLKKFNEELIRLKTENKKLKSMIEIQNDDIKAIQKSHLILQEKYLLLCSNKKIKIHKELVEQARKMKLRKIERDKRNSVFVLKKEEYDIFNNNNLSDRILKKSRNILSLKNSKTLNEEYKLPNINDNKYYRYKSHLMNNDEEKNNKF